MSDDIDRHDLGPLLARIAAGDRSASGELFARIRPYLHSLVRKTMGGADKDASDIVQSSLRRINENLGGLMDDNPTVPHLLAWVKKIVRNRALDELRRRGAAHAPRTGEAFENVPGKLGFEEHEADVDRQHRALRVMTALAKLPERRRQVVEMHYFDRLSDADICDRIGGTVAAVRVLRCRALDQLRELMEADDASR